MNGLSKLQKHLQRCFPSLHGEWVSGKKKYEKGFALAIGATIGCTRYWDCVWKGMRLELKLGGLWFDLIRYSESFFPEKYPAACVEVITLCMPYSWNESSKIGRVNGIYAVKTSRLIEVFELTKKTARNLVLANEGYPRTLNAQARLTYSDVRSIAEFYIS